MAPTQRRQLFAGNLGAVAARPTRELCERRRTAARRQNNDVNALYPSREQEGILSRVRDAGRGDVDRGKAWTFEFPNDGRTDRTAIVALRADVQVGRRERNEKHKRERRYARNDLTVERHSQ